MDTHQYINSGVLEAYLLGIASDEEQQEVQLMTDTYPEISFALTELEVLIEQQCLENAVPPPPGTWEAIQARTTGKELKKRSQPHYRQFDQKEAEEADKPEYLDVEVKDTHLRVHKYWRPAFIAVFILGKIFLALACYYYFKADSQNQEIERLRTEIREMRVR